MQNGSSTKLDIQHGHSTKLRQSTTVSRLVVDHTITMGIKLAFTLRRKSGIHRLFSSRPLFYILVIYSGRDRRMSLAKKAHYGVYTVIILVSLHR